MSVELKDLTSKDKLTLQGLYRLFQYGHDDMAHYKMTKDAIFENPVFIESYLNIIANSSSEELYPLGVNKSDILNKIFREMREGEEKGEEDFIQLGDPDQLKDFYSDPIWKNIIDTTLSDSATLADPYSRVTYHIDAASMIPDYEWGDLFQKYYSEWKSSWLSTNFQNVIKLFAFKNSDSFKTFVEDDIFYAKKKPGFALRSECYAHYVNLGFLNEKTARKIRSDGAEDASLAGLKALVHSDLYEDKTNLLLQFTDSRYSGVLGVLAAELPIHLLASIMGSDDWHVKRIVERRLMESEEG